MKKLKPRHEAFCQAFVIYANAALAAREAGYTPGSARKQGYRLMQDERITRRIAEVQSEMARDHCPDAGVLMGKLETVYRRAIEDHRFYAAARAVELQARLAGFFHDARLPRSADGADAAAADVGHATHAAHAAHPVHPGVHPDAPAGESTAPTRALADNGGHLPERPVVSFARTRG